MPKIYERNPDTDEVRSYERVKPSPYRNEMEEAIEILKRIESKLQYICEVGVSKSDTTPYSTWKDIYEQRANTILYYVIDIRSILQYNGIMKYYIYCGIGYIAYVCIFAYVMTTYFGY